MFDIYSRDFMLVPRVLRDFFGTMDAQEFHWKNRPKRPTESPHNVPYP
jgi:hypothetical protein